MNTVTRPVTLGVIMATRGFFNPALAVEGGKNLVALLQRLGIRYVIGGEEATLNGAVETLADDRPNLVENL